MIKNYTLLNGFRFERKFIDEKSDPILTELYIKTNPFGFREIFQERYINNVYFDTPRLDFYYDNVNGRHDRVKYRIRWYGDLFGYIEKPILELKIKKGNVGSKKSFLLKPFTFSKNMKFSIFEEIFEQSELPGNVRTVLKNLNPSLINRYKRKYFACPYENFRITIDKDIEYYPVNSSNLLVFKQVENNDVIIELKYKNIDNENADKITQFLPFRLTKNSKYVNGIEKFYNVID